MGLLYDDFLKLTPRRWAYLYKGWSEQREALLKFYHDTVWQATAWQTAWLINMSGKTVAEPVTPDGLLNPDRTEREPEKPEDILADLSRTIDTGGLICQAD